MLSDVHHVTLRRTHHHRNTKMTRRQTHYDIERLHVQLARIIQHMKGLHGNLGGLLHNPSIAGICERVIDCRFPFTLLYSVTNKYTLAAIRPVRLEDE